MDYDKIARSLTDEQLTKLEEGWFSDCPRDENGRCKPKGGGGSSKGGKSAKLDKARSRRDPFGSDPKAATKARFSAAREKAELVALDNKPKDVSWDVYTDRVTHMSDADLVKFTNSMRAAKPRPVPKRKGFLGRVGDGFRSQLRNERRALNRMRGR